MRISTIITALALPLALAAQSPDDGAPDKVTVHGSIQSDILFPEEDIAIGTAEYSNKVITTNTYANANVFSKYVDGGVRFEFLRYPLPGFEPRFKGWGVPNVYVTGKFKGMDLTLGDFYEQFGSGFILRTYEERSLGIDNSIRGVRARFNNIKGMRLTALGGVQRYYWNWNMHTKLAGADAEISLDSYAPSLRDKGVIWTLGASYVFKHERDESIVVPGTNFRLNLPENVNSFDLRTQFNRNSWNLQAEYAWKSPDPSLDNNYTYRHGDALMLSGSYSKKGFSALLQAKRSENMAFRSRRSVQGIGAFLNNMPAFAYQHTYALAAMYPYATQAAPGEWALQAAVAYNFKRGTALGGKYGTKLRLNASYIRGLQEKDRSPLFNGSQFGTDGVHNYWLKMGSLYYEDINVQLEKKITSSFNLNAMYMFQRYNQAVIEGHGEMVKASVAVVDAKYRFDKRYTLRGELQYLATGQDNKDWCYGLVELSVLPYLMFSASDMWNCGNDDKKLHYYMFSVTGNYKSNRLMLGYGRTRAGYNCSGGVCRYVPASRGFQITYNYNF